MARRSQRLRQKSSEICASRNSPNIVVSPYFLESRSKESGNWESHQPLCKFAQGSLNSPHLITAKKLGAGVAKVCSSGENCRSLLQDRICPNYTVGRPLGLLSGSRDVSPDANVSDTASNSNEVTSETAFVAKAVNVSHHRRVHSSLVKSESRTYSKRLRRRPPELRELESSKPLKRFSRSTLAPSENNISTSCETSSVHHSDKSDDWKPISSSSGETAGSSDDFEPVKTFRTHPSTSQKKPRRTVAKRNVSRNVRSKVSNELKFDGESDNADDWEDVEDGEHCDVKEVDFMQCLLNAEMRKENVEDSHLSSKVLTVSVPNKSLSDRKVNNDPQLQERREALRRLRETFRTVHHVHILCFLAHVRFLNSLCDNPLYRSLGLSLLSTTQPVLHSNSEFIDIASWDLEHLRACVSSILSLKGSATDATGLTLLHRVANYHVSATDCVILLVSALRALGFDVRLIVGLTPLPMNPTATAANTLRTSVCNNHTKKGNRKIVSSSSDEGGHSLYSLDSSTPTIHTFFEVYLLSRQRWVPVQLSSFENSVDLIADIPPKLYVIGATAIRLCDVANLPYVGRNPVDLTARYDPEWCVKSRAHRLPETKWNQILQYQRHLFDLLAARSGTLVAKTENLATRRRDSVDEDSIRSGLLRKPLPNRVQDFKNHPLYVLPRHLLKFEVIYPSDATPVGFFRNEPVYNREYVHVCSTRETWLKEAKTVRLHEKPVKVVKARMSLKRKLLQGTDNTPATVELFGPWQLEDYKPPVAQNGVVPRNEHGTVDMFKPCMLPIGCAHICLTGIQHVAKKLGIDCAPAIVGWNFKGSGWAIPIINGYIVCKENARTLIDAWRTVRMDAAKAAAEERSSRAVDNWCRLVRGLFLWNKVKAQFALAALHDAAPSKRSKPPTLEENALGLTSMRRQKPGTIATSGTTSGRMTASASAKLDESGSESDSGNWQHLSTSVCTPQPVALLRSLSAATPKRGRRVSRSQRSQPRKRPVPRNEAKSNSSTSEDVEVKSGSGLPDSEDSGLFFSPSTDPALNEIEPK
ncbi:unnamed protein product [Dicrocoelium dendriticum]|nr:unnamed protein product [Dicrocoelium dendriticum]